MAKNEKTERIEKLTLAMLIATFAILAFNMAQIGSLVTQSDTGNVATGQVVGQSSQVVEKSAPAPLSNGPDVIPKGVPDIYGAELSVSFDDVSPTDPRQADATIRVLAQIDRDTELEGDDLERYIAITSQISCEYCCGAKSIIFDNGKPACGCAHSYAMRGLAKYLVTEHGDEYTDDEILEELGKWKTLFFPTQITQKAQILQDDGVELNYINLASNKYRGIEQGVTGGMVGGC